MGAQLFKRRYTLLAIAVLALVFFNWERIVSWGGDDRILPASEVNNSTSPDIKVLTRPVIISRNDRVFNALGTGRAEKSVAIYPAVAEEVRSVHFNAQEAVAKNALLVQLDDREEALAVKLAEVSLKDAKSLLVRYESAVKDGAVPQSEVDSARARVDSAQVALEQARLALAERKITAPFNGIVGIPQIDPGDRVDSTTMITGLDDRTNILVDFEVPESLAGVLQQGQEIVATTPAFPGKEFRGKVRALESRVDPEKRSITARAQIPNDEDLLRPGMSFSTRMEIDGAPYPSIPEIALQWSRDGAFIWLVRGGKAVKLPVQVATRSGGMVLVEGDLQEGEAVVVEGLQRVQDGRAVEAHAIKEEPPVTTEPVPDAESTSP